MKLAFSKAYQPAKYEKKIYRQWEKSGAFNPDKLKIPQSAKNYSIVMPPPNVTGTLHLGHAVMLAVEDLLIRHYRMRGYRTLWLPGTDHAAIATQTKVEKLLKEKEGKTRHQLGRKKFLKAVEEFAQASHDTIVNQVKKLGSSCDWSREAYTLDRVRTQAVRSVFKLMYEDGLIYRGERVVNWCPRCHSTLADDEVEYQNQKATLYTFRYDKNFPFAIATTRPETKLGDTAIAINPKDSRYKKYIGKTFKANFCGIPLKLKIVASREVAMDFGTGALGVTPAHSFVDWKLSQKHQLKIIKVIDENGRIRNGFKEFSQKSALKARQQIIQCLKENNLLEKEETIENNLSVCYRCGEPIEPLPSQQWFIDVNKKIKRLGEKSLKQISLEAVKKGIFKRKPIKIIPQRFEKTYFNWVNNLEDWCISRQIWFGHQVPVWYRENPRNGKQETYVGINPPRGKNWEQDPDTLDTWFSSGLWTFSTLARKGSDIKIAPTGHLVINSEDFRRFHPTTVLETGYDILFFWVARMIIMTAYAIQDIPFRDVYLHGLVTDRYGKKMSKSKGNVIDPLEMARKYGTDAVRLSLIVGSTPGNDSRVYEEKIAGARNFVNKLWNISRYVAENSFSKATFLRPDRPPQPKTLADRWILAKLNGLTREITYDIKAYNFSAAGEKLREFVWDNLADWYLEISKIEKGKNHILTYVLVNTLKLCHPFMPFVTEQIFQNLNQQANLTKTKRRWLLTQLWPLPLKRSVPKKTLAGFAFLQEMITKVRYLRSFYRIAPNIILPASFAGSTTKSRLVRKHLSLVEKLTGTSFTIANSKTKRPSQAATIALSDAKIFINLKGVIDFEKERKRIAQELIRAKSFCGNLEQKLKNKKFIKGAPKEIVTKEKHKLVQWQKKIRALKQSLADLK